MRARHHESIALPRVKTSTRAAPAARQRGRAGIGSGAGGHHVVDEEHALFAHALGRAYAEGVADVAAPLERVEPPVCGGVSRGALERAGVEGGPGRAGACSVRAPLRADAAASSAAWLNSRARSRRGCSGTGTIKESIAAKLRRRAPQRAEEKLRRAAAPAPACDATSSCGSPRRARRRTRSRPRPRRSAAGAAGSRGSRRRMLQLHSDDGRAQRGPGAVDWRQFVSAQPSQQRDRRHARAQARRERRSAPDRGGRARHAIAGRQGRRAHSSKQS